MITTIPVSHGFSWNIIAGRVMLFCGILSPLLYVVMNIFIPMQWTEYNISSQTVSELSAIDAPTRPVWVPLGILYALLFAAFGVGVWQVANNKKGLRILGAILFINGCLSFFWPPMHQREVLAAGGATFTDTMHIIFSIATVFLFVSSLVIAAAAFGKAFRVYSVITLLVLIVFGILTGVQAPNMEADLPTPLMGVWERINIGIYMLWMVVLAIKLLLMVGKKEFIGKKLP